MPFSKLLKDEDGTGRVHPAWNEECYQRHGFGGYCLCVRKGSKGIQEGRYIGSYAGVKRNKQDLTESQARYSVDIHPRDDGSTHLEVIDASEYGNMTRKVGMPLSL